VHLRLLPLCLLPLLGCGEEPPPQPEVERPVGVTVRDNVFDPDQVSVRVGQHVTWIWEGQSAHSIRFAGSPTNAAPSQVEGLYDRVFDQPGTYAYYCTIHGSAAGLTLTGMAGQVVVRP
jgi:plastocyanin